MSKRCLNNVVNFRKMVFDKIAANNSGQIWRTASLRDVKNVVIINSAARSGSSLLFEVLRKIPQFYSLSGEGTPFYKLSGFSKGPLFSDEIPAEFKKTKAFVSGLSRDFLSDFSLASSQNNIFKDNTLLGQYIDDLALRFSMQWPQINFSYDDFKQLAQEAFDAYRRVNRVFCKESFYLELFRCLRRQYKAINPYYYDISVKLIAKNFPGLKVPSGPPNATLAIEEPPFILLSPHQKANCDDLENKVLLLKSSVDCYRMHFMESLFPQANIKIIYLTRNPAAAINGLYDGWLHRGFFSHNLKDFFNKNSNCSGLKALKISGYSDKYAWGKWWWNYDLPLGWQNYAQSKLEEVCGFQWYSANQAIGAYLNQSRKQYCRVSYENIIKSLGSRKKEIGKIINFIGLGKDLIKQLALDKLAIVQATEVPRPYRWRKRKDILLPLLNDVKISQMASRLGYHQKNIKEWY